MSSSDRPTAPQGKQVFEIVRDSETAQVWRWRGRWVVWLGSVMTPATIYFAIQGEYGAAIAAAVVGLVALGQALRPWKGNVNP